MRTWFCCLSCQVLILFSITIAFTPLSFISNSNRYLLGQSLLKYRINDDINIINVIKEKRTIDQGPSHSINYPIIDNIDNDQTKINSISNFNKDTVS